MILHCPWLHVSGMALWPFILIRNKSELDNCILLNHERIHLRQQLEMGVVFFYLFYVAHFAFNLMRYRNYDQAYRNIIFEREAYTKDSDLNYLVERKLWAWIRY